jgi:hypothetical protein
MATRAERFRSEQERTSKHPKPRRGPHKARPAAGARKQKRTSKKASFAFEPHAPNKRASRKSTRGSANRGKPDTSYDHVEEMRSSAPKNRYVKSRAKKTRVRGR